jgi:hypothetical protein
VRDSTPLLDSKEGIEEILRFARVGNFVLNGYHREIAEKYSLPTDGVIFAGPLPQT